MSKPRLFAITDVETTGGKPSHERITEIAILLHNGKRVIEEYSSLVNPGRPIDPFVVALTGIADDMVSGAPTFGELAEEILRLTEGAVFVAHNVRFDYRMLRSEFRLLGQPFLRKQICTVRLSRQIFPDQPSYGLGRLCKGLDIPIFDRHRAFGDAQATAILFEKLLFNDRHEMVESVLNEGIQDNLLPAGMTREKLDEIPDDVGVYYFKDERGKILYVGKSTNIRKRIFSHFSGDMKARRFQEMKEKVHDIGYQLTGNDLIAMLLESHEIKKWMPPYNRAQRRRRYRFGIYRRIDEVGFERLVIEMLKPDDPPIIQCSSRRAAESMLDRISSKYDLYMYEAVKRNASTHPDRSDSLKEFYSVMIDKALANHRFARENFFVVGAGLHPESQSVVQVEDGQYKGFGYFNPAYQPSRKGSLPEYVDYYEDNPEVRHIIRRWLRRHKKAMIPYEKPKNDPALQA